MENKKYEQLIDLIINEQEDKARELFHEIVVEKSREIYESIMDEEVMEMQHDDMEEGMHGQVGDLLDEINVEETGMTEEEEEVESDIEVDDAEGDMDMDMDMEAGEGEEVSVEKDELGDIKDKLEDLMAEFESLMGGDSSGEEVVAGEEDAEEVVAEAVNLKQVGGKTYNTYGKMGDDGADKKSPVPANSGAKGMDSKPVKFSGDSESVPTGPKGPSNAYAKGEKDLPGANNFKNVPGKDNFKEKGESAPKPVTSQASGVNNKSPVAKG